MENYDQKDDKTSIEKTVAKASSADAQKATLLVEEDNPSQVYTSSKVTIGEKTKQQSSDTTIVKPMAAAQQAKHDDQEVVIELH